MRKLKLDTRPAQKEQIVLAQLYHQLRRIAQCDPSCKRKVARSCRLIQAMQIAFLKKPYKYTVDVYLVHVELLEAAYRLGLREGRRK